jgi:hypothetical protein
MVFRLKNKYYFFRKFNSYLIHKNYYLASLYKCIFSKKDKKSQSFFRFLNSFKINSSLILTSDLNSLKSSLILKIQIVSEKSQPRIKSSKLGEPTIFSRINNNTIKVNKIIPTAITSRNLLFIHPPNNFKERKYKITPTIDASASVGSQLILKYRLKIRPEITKAITPTANALSSFETTNNISNLVYKIFNF